ncbi:hypothetical protein A0H76_612 [Hepatospora eriocheir]|uniref:Uncharacterized protein n=1 Tax=Hepatospora eriocheir TaxID=1081669 RepID=A0A1X0Q7T0_9MICR|nr:hypothetical protein A0H76_612 [Hepatospora eriocheir]
MIHIKEIYYIVPQIKKLPYFFLPQQRSLLVDTSFDIFVVDNTLLVDKDIKMKKSNVNILTVNNRKLKCLGYIE